MLGPLMMTRERAAWATVVALLATVSAWLFAGTLVLGYNMIAVHAPEVATVIRLGLRAAMVVARAGLPGAVVIGLGAILVAGILYERREEPAESVEVRRA